MSSQDILNILKASLETEEMARRKNEILPIIKIIENESLYNAILYDFLTIRWVCQLRYEEAYQIPEVRRVFLDCLKNPSLKSSKKDMFGFEIVEILADRLDINILKQDEEFNQIISNLSYEQADRILGGRETDKLFDDPKYYEIFQRQAKLDNRLYKLFPYSKQSLEDGTYINILEQDTDLKHLSKQDNAMIIEVLKRTDKILDLSSIIKQLKNYTEELQKFIISKKEYATQLIYQQANIDYGLSILPTNLEAELIQQNVNVFDEMSYNQKFNFIYNMNDPEIQKYLIQKIKFMDNLLSHKDYAKIFLNIKDKDFMIDCLAKKDVLENMYNIELRKILKELSPIHQRQLYDNKVFKEYFLSLNRFDAFQLLGYFEEEIIDSIISQLKNPTIYEIMTIFKTCNNHKYLKDVQESIIEAEKSPNEDLASTINYFCKNYVFDKDALKILTNEEFEFFLERFNSIKESKDATSFLDRFSIDEPISESDMDIINNIDFNQPVSEQEQELLYKHRKRIVYEKQLKEVFEILSKENSRVVNKIGYAIFETLTEEQTKMLLDCLTIECLVVLLSVSPQVIDYCYDLYQQDPHIFDNIGEIPYIYVSFNGSELPQHSIDKLVNMFETLSINAQEAVMNETLVENEKIKNIIKTNLANDPNIYSGKTIRKKLQSIYTEEEFKYLLEQMSLNNFIQLHSEMVFRKDKHKKLIDEIFKNRQEEILHNVIRLDDDDSFPFNINTIIKKILNNTEDKKSIINKLSTKKLISLYESLNSNFDKDEHKESIKIVLEVLVERQKELISLDDNDLKKLLSNQSPSQLASLIKEYNVNEIIELFAKTNNKDLEDKITYEFIKQPYFKNNTNLSIEEILSKLDPANKEIITNCINEQYDELNTLSKLKSKLRKVSCDEKMFLIYGTRSNILNEEKLTLINNLLDKDPFAITSLNIDLFEDKIFEISKNIIPKIYRYENLTKEYLNLLNSKNKNSKLMLLLIEHLNSTTTNMDIYAKKLDAIIKYFTYRNDLNIDKYNLTDATIEELQYLEEYIYSLMSDHLISQKLLFLYGKTTVEELEGNTFKEINNNRIIELENKMLDNPDIDLVKECIFKKYFNLDMNKVEIIIRKYDTSLESVKDNIKNKECLAYYNELKNIFNSTNLEELKQYYYNNNKIHKLDECLYLYNEFDKVYNTSIAESLRGYKNGKHTTLSITNNEELKHVGVIELDSDFDLIVHSTDAYGSMEMINDNYFDSWNYSEKTSNHGICASFISNSNLGTANVKGKGVMFGFTKLNSKSISSMAPYDLVSKNDGIITTTKRPPMYTNVKDLADYTRHTHNEIVLERRNVSEDSLYPVIQPDCLIIFEEMADKIKQNTLQAQADFKERGIDLPIIYINRKKVAEKESRRVQEMLNIYDQNPNLELLAEIINKYESNRCGEDFEQTFKPEELFDKERIYNTILKTIEYIKSNNDVNLAKQLINIINHENYKFTLIKESVGERAHSFDLLDEKLMEELNTLENQFVNSTPEFNTSFVV